MTSAWSQSSATKWVFFFVQSNDSLSSQGCRRSRVRGAGGDGKGGCGGDEMAPCRIGHRLSLAAVPPPLLGRVAM